MPTIKEFVQVIIDTVPRLAADVYGNEWPAHPHHAHTELDDDDHLQYMLCSAGADRAFTGDVYLEEDLRIIGESSLTFDDHWRDVHTIGAGDWTWEGINLSDAPAEWQDFYDVFGHVSLLAAMAVAGGTGNSLDGAYDFGGAGVGRAIVADTGAVSITVPLDADNSALYLESTWTGAPPSTYDNATLYINKEIYSAAAAWADSYSIFLTGADNQIIWSDKALWVGMGDTTMSAGGGYVSFDEEEATIYARDATGTLPSYLTLVGGAAGNATIKGNLNTRIYAGSNITFSDGYRAGSTYSVAIPFSSSSAEWDALEVLIGSEGSVVAGILAAAASGNTLDGAYDFGGAGVGRSITADTGAVLITSPDESGNFCLDLVQSDATNNSDAVQISNAGTGHSIYLHGSGSKTIYASSDLTLAAAVDVLISPTSGFTGINQAAPDCGLHIGSGAAGTVSASDDLYITGATELGGDVYTDRWLDSATNTFFGVGVCGNGNLTHASGNQGWYNTAFGNQSQKAMTAGFSCCSFGRDSLLSNTGAAYCNAFGDSALRACLGSSNDAFGTNAGRGTRYGTENCYFGASAGRYIYDTNYNSIFGSSAVSNISSSAVEGVCAFGYKALEVVTGNGSIGVGYKAGDNLTSADYCIIIGYDIDFPSATADYQLNIGGLIYGIMDTGMGGVNKTVPTVGWHIGTGVPGVVSTNADLYVTNDAEIASDLYLTGGKFAVTADASSTITVPAEGGSVALTLTNLEPTNTSEVLSILNEATTAGHYAIYIQGDAGDGDFLYGHKIWSPEAITVGSNKTIETLDSWTYASHRYNSATDRIYSDVGVDIDTGAAEAYFRATGYLFTSPTVPQAQALMYSTNQATVQSGVGSALLHGYTTVTLLSDTDNIILDSAAEIRLDDGYRIGSTWTQTYMLLSDDTDDWDEFEAAFGEVSLMGAIVQAAGGLVEPAGQIVYGTGTSVDSEAGLFWDTTNDLLKITSDVSKTNWYDAGAYSIHLTGSATQGQVIFSDKELTIGVYHESVETDSVINILARVAGETHGNSIITINAIGPYSGTLLHIGSDYLLELEADNSILIDSPYIDLDGNDLASIGVATFDDDVAADFTTDTITVDWDDGNIQSVTITAACTDVNFSAPSHGGAASLTLIVKATGAARTIAGFDAGVIWAGASPEGESIPQDDEMTISLIWRGGTVYKGSWILDA